MSPRGARLGPRLALAASRLLALLAPPFGLLAAAAFAQRVYVDESALLAGMAHAGLPDGLDRVDGLPALGTSPASVRVFVLVL